VRHQTEAHAEHHGTGYETLAKYAFLFGENFVGDVRVHVQHESIECHALAFRNCAPDGAGAQANFEILVEPVFLIPDANCFVLGGIGVRVRQVDSSLAARSNFFMSGWPPVRDAWKNFC